VDLMGEPLTGSPYLFFAKALAVHRADLAAGATGNSTQLS
jgi:hypothetical protein